MFGFFSQTWTSDLSKNIYFFILKNVLSTKKIILEKSYNFVGNEWLCFSKHVCGKNRTCYLERKKKHDKCFSLWFLLAWTVPVFKVHNKPTFSVAPLERLTALNVLSAMGLGFLLALLIFIDQNIVVSLTNAPENRWEKTKKKSSFRLQKLAPHAGSDSRQDGGISTKTGSRQMAKIKASMKSPGAHAIRRKSESSKNRK